ncbi:MAG TPA: hypothetical protein DDW65_02890 [Firmicutes bacterium]|jgi:sensor histidine kinase YesM|nr:hypothetical protein [Bacillota bacterium]
MVHVGHSWRAWRQVNLRGYTVRIALAMVILVGTTTIALGLLMTQRLSDQIVADMIQSDQSQLAAFNTTFTGYLETIASRLQGLSGFLWYQRNENMGAADTLQDFTEEMRGRGVQCTYALLATGQLVTNHAISEAEINRRGWVRTYNRRGLGDEILGTPFGTETFFLEKPLVRWRFTTSLPLLVVTVHNGHPAGVIGADIDAHVLVYYLSRKLFGTPPPIFSVYDTGGHFLFSTNTTELIAPLTDCRRSNPVLAEALKHQDQNAGSKIISVFGRKILRVWVREPHLGWIVIKDRDWAVMVQPAISYRNNLLLITAIFLLMAVLAAVILARSLGSPVHQMAEVAQRLANGDFSITPNVNVHGELGEISRILQRVARGMQELLGKMGDSIGEGTTGRVFGVPSTFESTSSLEQSFTLLSQRVADLSRALESARVRQREEELRALQAQINPHFLYNTLSAIRWQALDLQAATIVSMVDALSRFYRLSLNKGNEFLTVEDEINLIKAYCEIQQFRFQGKFAIIYELQPAALGLRTIKLILQPLVENVFCHAVTGISRVICIRITAARQGEFLILAVTDDGCGMSSEYVDTVMSGQIQATDSRGYGLRNVHDRIQLYYGNEYGLRVDTAPEKGTRVEVRIPVQSVEEN